MVIACPVVNRGRPKVVVLGAQGALGRLCVPALRRASVDVVRAGRRAESSSDFRLIDVSDAAAVEQGFRLSEVRDGFEEQGIRIEAMA